MTIFVKKRPGNLGVGSPGSAKTLPWAGLQPIQSGVPFFFVLVYLLSFYLHLPARIPGMSAVRPDLLLAIIVIATLVPNMKLKSEILRHPVSRALGLFIALVFIALPFVEWPGSVLRYNIPKFVKAVLFFYFVILTVDTPKRFRIFLFFLISTQVFRVLEPLYLNLTEGYLGSKTYAGDGEFAGRLSGAPADVVNPNGLGFIIATTTVFIHFLLWQSKKFFHKLLYLALVPTMLYALVLSMSRGGFVALLVGGWLIFRQSRQKAVVLLVAVVIAVGSWSIMSDHQRDRYLSLVSSDAKQSSTTEGRIRGTLGEFRLGLNRPVFGHGLGTTPEAKANFAGGKQASHNLYGEVLIETGAIGFFLFALFLVRIHRVIKENRQQLSPDVASSPYTELYARSGRGLIAVFWVYAVYSINYYGVSQAYWYVFGGLCVSFSVMIQDLRRNIVDETVRPRNIAA